MKRMRGVFCDQCGLPDQSGYTVLTGQSLVNGIFLDFGGEQVVPGLNVEYENGFNE